MQTLCTFYLDNLYIGIPVDKVQEVLAPLPITPVPGSTLAVAGLINVRGQTIAAINLRECLCLPSSPHVANHFNMIVQRELDPVSFLVDRMGEVIELDDREFTAPPDAISAEILRLVRGAYKRSDRLLLVLDDGAVVDRVIENHRTNKRPG